MCASALVQVGIGCVVYGCGNERFGGCGSVLNVSTIQQQHQQQQDDSATAGGGKEEEVGAVQCHFTCISGVRAAEAIDALKQFYARGNPNGQTTPPQMSRQPPADDVSMSVHLIDFRVLSVFCTSSACQASTAACGANGFTCRYFCSHNSSREERQRV